MARFWPERIKDLYQVLVLFVLFPALPLRLEQGEDHEGDVLDVARTVAESGIRIYCVGVGSPAGKPIPAEGGLLKDKDGNIVVTKLDEDILRQIAGVGGGKYVRAGNGEFGLNPIIDDIRSLEKEAFNSMVFEDFNEQYMYFFALALFFLILEALIPQVRAKRNIFSKEERR